MDYLVEFLQISLDCAYESVLILRGGRVEIWGHVCVGVNWLAHDGYLPLLMVGAA
jgi:hypothetical protein